MERVMSAITQACRSVILVGITACFAEGLLLNAAHASTDATPPGFTPRGDQRLIEWAVAEIGADRILFSTDTPVYHTAMQRARIDQDDLSESDKKKILRDNAMGLWSAERLEKTKHRSIRTDRHFDSVGPCASRTLKK